MTPSLFHVCLTGSAKSTPFPPEHFIPKAAIPGDAGFDLRTVCGFEIAVGEQKTVPLGCKVAIPEGWVGLICSRSGLAMRYGIQVTNAPGVIDSGYRGELMAILSRVAVGAEGPMSMTDETRFRWHAPERETWVKEFGQSIKPKPLPYRVDIGDAVAQLVVVPCMSDCVVMNQSAWEMAEFNKAARGEGRFGHTGR